MSPNILSLLWCNNYLMIDGQYTFNECSIREFCILIIVCGAISFTITTQVTELHPQC